MPSYPFVPMSPARVRKDPLGPTSVNQLHVNIAAVDDVARIEHFADGQHNALEVPWVLGHLDDGSPPSAYLLDSNYGGGSPTRPATGAYLVDVVSGVISTSEDGATLQVAGMANVSDSAIEVKPHTITMNAESATSVRFRVRELSSALGAGDTWADVNRDIDIGIHALPQAQDASLLASYTPKQRRDFLTEDATDWNSVVGNQGIVRKASLVEHTSAGLHSVNRIAKAVAWVRWTGAAYVLDADYGVASVAAISTGVVELTMDANFSALTTMACFPEVQPALSSELAIINGRGFATGAGTSTFRFYIYVFDGSDWARDDRTFFVPMFGVVA